MNTAFEAMRNLRFKEPVVAEKENAVVHIKHGKLAPAEDSVMEYHENNDMITNRAAREITGIKSENSMKVVFWRLSDRGLIEPVPGVLVLRLLGRRSESEMGASRTTLSLIVTPLTYCSTHLRHDQAARCWDSERCPSLRVPQLEDFRLDS